MKQDDEASHPKDNDDHDNEGTATATGGTASDGSNNGDRPEEDVEEDDDDERHEDIVEPADGGGGGRGDARDAAVAPPPTSKFKQLDRVLARDTDGLLYHAIIRRSLYGPHTHKQVQVGMVSSQKELDECMKEIEDEEEAHHPIWHYFVHFLKWKVNWDRWVSETDILALTEDTEAFAAKILAEHKALQREFKTGLTARRKGGGGALPTVDGGAFLRSWTIKLNLLKQEEAELQVRREEQRRERERQEREQASKEGDSDGGEEDDDDDEARRASRRSDRKKPVHATWSAEAAASAQQQARLEEEKRRKAQEEKDKIEAAAAASAKKKANANGTATTGWSKPILNKEQRLRQRDLSCIFGTTNTKTGATANDAKNVLLNKYKITFPFSIKKTLVEEWEIISTCHMVANVPVQISIRQALQQYLDSKLPTATAGLKMQLDSTDEAGNGDEDAMKVEDQGKDKSDGDDTAKKKMEKDWTDMVQGIALFFDQALPFRLLYHQEIPQYTILMKQQQQEIKLQAQKEREEKQQGTATEQGEGSKKDDTTIKQETTESKIVPSSGPTPTETPSSIMDTTSTADSNSLATATPSDLYGCEHLLRLFLRLPALLAEDQLEQRRRRQKRKVARAAAQKEKDKAKGKDKQPLEDETPNEDDGDNDDEEDIDLRQRNTMIIARVNDLVRFLHKHQSTLFAQSYRKMTQIELREQAKLHKRTAAKRKRTSGEGVGSGGGSDGATTGVVVATTTTTAVTTTTPMSVVTTGGGPGRKRRR